MLVGLGVGVHARRPRPRARRARPSRSPRRTPCRRPAAPRSAQRSTDRRPGDAGTSSSPPARRGGCARRSAPVAARPAAGCAVRSWSWERGARLAARDVIVRALSMAATVPTLDTERIRDANIRYHDAAARGYDSKWAIDYGEIGARPGARQAVEGARPAAGPLRSRARDRRRHRLLHASTCARQGVIGHAIATDISPGMLERLAETAEELGLEVETGRPTPSRCRSRTSRSTSCSATRCCTTCPGSTGRWRSSTACSHPAARWRSWASRRATATGSRRCRSGSAHCSSRRGAGRCARPRRHGAGSAPPAEETYGALEGLVDVHTFTPGALQELAHERRLHRRARVAARSCWRTSTAGSCAGSRPTSTQPPSRSPGTSFAFSSYLALQWLDGKLLEPRLPAEPLLQPADLRPPARLIGVPPTA